MISVNYLDVFVIIGFFVFWSIIIVLIESILKGENFMQGGVRKRGNKWYYYFDFGMVDANVKKLNAQLKVLKLKLKQNLY